MGDSAVVAELAIKRDEATLEQYDAILGDSEHGSTSASLFDVEGTYWAALRMDGTSIVAIEVRLQETRPRDTRISASETLRRLPLKSMERATREALSVALLNEASPSGTSRGELTGLLEGDRQRRMANLGALPKKGKRGPRGSDPSWYEAVAVVANDAARTGRSPATAIVEHFHTSTSTAARWLATCRRMGLIEKGD